MQRALLKCDASTPPMILTDVGCWGNTKLIQCMFSEPIFISNYFFTKFFFPRKTQVSKLLTNDVKTKVTCYLLQKAEHSKTNVNFIFAINSLSNQSVKISSWNNSEIICMKQKKNVDRNLAHAKKKRYHF